MLLHKTMPRDARPAATVPQHGNLIAAPSRIMPFTSTAGPTRLKNGMETMKALAWSSLVVCVSLGTALSAAAQTPVGAQRPSVACSAGLWP